MTISKLFKRKTTPDTPSVSVYNLLEILGIPATYTQVEKTLQEHPDYPSLLSLAESLPEWGIETEGVSGEIGDLTEADYPSIVHLTEANLAQDYAVLEGLQDGKANIIYPVEGRQSHTLHDFAKVWTGILLRARPGDQTGEPNYRANRKARRLSLCRKLFTYVGFPAVFLLAFGLALAEAGSWSVLLPLGMSKTTGFLLSLVMVAANLGDSTVMNSLCPSGRIANCQRVMYSPAGRLFGVSMAEWGMLYFSGGLLSLLISVFVGGLSDNIFFLGIMGGLVLPYTLFSVAYQAFAVRSWCWLCLVIQALFWFEAYVLYDTTATKLSNDLSDLGFPFSLLIGFGGVVVVWVTLRNLVVSARKTNSLDRKIIQLRRNPDYVQTQLTRAEVTDMGRFPFEVEVGTANADIAMTIVVNPLCGHCWKAFAELDQMIKVGRGKIKANVRFLVSDTDDNQTDTEKMLDREVSLRIVTMAEQGERERVHEALRAWFAEDDRFSKGKYDRWAREFPVKDTDSRENAASILTAHGVWARQSKVAGTPTLFFGDRRLPVGMQLGDLKIFLLRQFGI